MPKTVQEFLEQKLERKLSDEEINQLYHQLVLGKEEKLEFDDPLFYQNVEWNESTKTFQAFVLHAFTEKKVFAEGDLIALLQKCKPTPYLVKALTAVLSKEHFVLVFYYLLTEYLKELKSLEEFLRGEPLFMHLLRERIELDPRVNYFYQNFFRASIRTIDKEKNSKDASFRSQILDEYCEQVIPNLPKFLIHYRNFLMDFFANKHQSVSKEKRRNFANSYIFLRFFAKLLSERATKSNTTLIQEILLKPINDNLLKLVCDTLPTDAAKWQKTVNQFLIASESFSWESALKEEKFEDLSPFSEHTNSRKAVQAISIETLKLPEFQNKNLLCYAQNKKFPLLLKHLNLMIEAFQNNFWGPGTVIAGHKDLFLMCIENQAPIEIFQALKKLHPNLTCLEKMDQAENSYWHSLLENPEKHNDNTLFIADQLIALGLKCNLKNKDGKTPLHVMLELRPKLTQLNIFLIEKMVIEGGASFLDKDNDSKSVMSLNNGQYKTIFEMINTKKEYTVRSVTSPIVSSLSQGEKKEKRKSIFTRGSSFLWGEPTEQGETKPNRSQSVTDLPTKK